jgi:hypothetical protein
MDGLGYQRFGAAGGDIGSGVSNYLALTTNLVRFTEAPRGGHFAPFEEPETYAEELRAFFRPYRA